MAEFAPTRTRDEHGWLEYPRDKPLRAGMFPEGLLEQIMTHPAKQQAYLHMDVVSYVSKPGDTVLDPFGGVGTTLISAAMGRNVVLVEIEQYYYDIIQQCVDYLEWCREHGKSPLEGYSIGNMLVLNADNRVVMPIPCDHVITSPPYGNDLYSGADSAVSKSGKSTRKLSTGGDVGLATQNAAEMQQYGQATQNIGKLPKFTYQQVMKQVYEKIVRSVRVGGTITVTHRDRIEAGERVLYVESIVGTLVKLGCGVKLLDKWKTPRTIQANVNRNLGVDVVEDEDVIIMERLR